jgi:hypothetical protein
MEIFDRPFIFPLAYMESHAVLAPVRTYGFKLMMPQLTHNLRVNPPSFLQQIEAKGWKIVNLKRRNLLRQAISYTVALQGREWHLKKADELKNSFPPEAKSAQAPRRKTFLDVAVFQEILLWTEAQVQYQDYALGKTPHMTVTYEDDLLGEENQQRTANRIFEYLGLDPFQVQTEYVRTGSDDALSNIENSEEIEGVIRGTQFEPFLNQP